ncbi:inner membrane protein YiaV [Polynucleobacter sp. SHI8]|uniref:HlyD family secretion protein n=1 Tax=unclassified Polynucleobacter TaxID=2640945 RepID=UPI002492431D|nr:MULTISPECIES: HlyD family secretion protein [unclassified Polynucleobacter]BDW11989.1 inner membrane protein YiaV [Polynucleobacter sp. SHI2]BDW14436.1 inner membrane protein YiaV [Polynucleobacter sp. SHI8]
MLEIILGGYAAIIWFVFIKKKWLPWNIKSQIGSAIGGIVLLATVVFTVNIITPGSEDVRVINFVTEVVPRVQGTITKVAVEGNTMVKKGDILIEIDPKPYQLKVSQLEAQLADTFASAKSLQQNYDASKANTAAAKAHLDLMNKRLAESTELAKTGAGNRYDVEYYQAEVLKAKSAYDATKSSENTAKLKLNAVVGEDNASVAQIKSQLESARYDLESCTVRAPADGYPVAVTVRPGNYAVSMPLRPLMSFVWYDQRIIAYFDQNELRFVKPGDDVELTLKAIPGKIIYGKVDSIIWASSQGQIAQSGTVPTAPAEMLHAPLPLKYAVKITPIEMDGEPIPTMPMGARGMGGVYTEHLKPLHIVRMLVIRLHAILNNLVFKLP